jgi:putative tricarboxylic transport membrane protein
MDALLAGFDLAFNLPTIWGVLLGTLVGLVFGSIPGLTYSMALALMLPVTFTLPAVPAMGVLLGTYVGGMTGGSVSAILIGVPGTPSAAATVLDGYPMTRQGHAAKALGTAVIVSVFGGLFSLIVMMVLVDAIAAAAIEFGPAEIFALVLFGMSTICGLAERSLTRGLIAGIIGLMLMTVGLDELEGIPRLTFGATEVQQGINLLVAMIGLFAVPHAFQIFLEYRTGENRLDGVSAPARATLPRWRDLRPYFGLMLRAAGIGTAVGAIPGTGGPIAAFLAYDHARRFSKTPEKFGKGELGGVVAPETANNAVTGGAMIPLLSLGIPGDPATAVILGGLLIHGLNPGPMLFVEHLPEIYALYIVIFAAYVVVLAAQLYGIRIFVRVLRIPPHLLAVGIIVMCILGSYAIRNSMFDVYTMCVMGLTGYVLLRVRIPVTPIVLGLVLGETLEREFRTAMIMSDGDSGIFVSSWIAIVFLALTALTIGWQIRGMFRDRAASRDGGADRQDPVPGKSEGA